VHSCYIGPQRGRGRQEGKKIERALSPTKALGFFCGNPDVSELRGSL
jgi:hypothetical protein